MAVIGSTYLDLIDLYKSQGPDGTLAADVIEILSKTNAILKDALAIECNNGTKHRTTTRTGLPAVAWGQLYKGIPQSKSTKAQVEDTTGFVEGLSSVDSRLLELAEDDRKLRLSEATSYLEALSQEAATTMFYGNVNTNPERFTGLAPRFSSTTAANGGQIVSAGGAGADNTSVWFITWGDTTCHTIYPKGTRAGISREDKGEQRITDATGAYFVKEELFRQHIGLSVRDWRFVARVANIDVSDLKAGTVDIYKYMRQAYWKVHRNGSSGGNLAIYCNADVMEALDAGATPTSSTSASFVRLTPKEVAGEEVLTYRGAPVRQVDAILNTEAVVS